MHLCDNLPSERQRGSSRATSTATMSKSARRRRARARRCTTSSRACGSARLRPAEPIKRDALPQRCWVRRVAPTTARAAPPRRVCAGPSTTPSALRTLGRGWLLGGRPGGQGDRGGAVGRATPTHLDLWLHDAPTRSKMGPTAPLRKSIQWPTTAQWAAAHAWRRSHVTRRPHGLPRAATTPRAVATPPIFRARSRLTEPRAGRRLTLCSTTYHLSGHNPDTETPLGHPTTHAEQMLKRCSCRLGEGITLHGERSETASLSR